MGSRAVSVIWRSLWKLLLTGFEGMSEVIKAAQAMDTISPWSGARAGEELGYFTSPLGGPSPPAAAPAPHHPCMYQQIEQLPWVWGLFFCSKRCHSHVHTALRPQTDSSFL